MDDRAWVGPDSRCPSGWRGFRSIEDLLSSKSTYCSIVFDDPAATLRDADFTRLYAHSPLSRIHRLVGPWRSGIGRTDAQWPLVTTCRDDFTRDSSPDDEQLWIPLTANYEDLAVETAVADLDGLRFQVHVPDHDLSEMWSDWLALSGGIPGEGEVDLAILDSSPSAREHVPSAKYFVVLSAAPWSDRQAATGQTDSRELIVSVLDAPAQVMRRVLPLIHRVAS